MRQVPHFLLIGNGRVASHFQYYFSQLNISYTAWHRQQSLLELRSHLAVATHVLVLISDNAIDEFIQTHKTNALWMHCSGSINSVYAFGVHPLMTFNQTLYSLEQYQQIPFVIDADAPPFNELLPGLPNHHVRLDKKLKTKYHALCVLSGNFSCLLWQKFFQTLAQDFNFPEQIGHPYLLQQMQNIIANPTAALTGPLARNDITTIHKHLIALENDPFLEVYQSFVATYQKLNQELSNECT